MRLNNYFLCSLFLATVSFSNLSAGEKKFTGSIPVKKQNSESYAAMSKLSIQEAIAIVNQKVPGKITEIALEREDGFLVYEVELITPEKVKKEVLIDAGNGELLLEKVKSK